MPSRGSGSARRERPRDERGSTFTPSLVISLGRTSAGVYPRLAPGEQAGRAKNRLSSGRIRKIVATRLDRLPQKIVKFRRFHAGDRIRALLPRRVRDAAPSRRGRGEAAAAGSPG